MARTEGEVPDRWFIWGAGTEFRQVDGRGVLMGGGTPGMDVVLARIVASDPGWAPPPPQPPPDPADPWPPATVNGSWVILTWGTEQRLRAFVDAHEDVRGMLRGSDVWPAPAGPATSTVTAEGEHR